MIAAEVLVVGAGPAGMTAAAAAAEHGRRVTVVDDNPAAGGQIWRASTVTGPRGNAASMRAVRRLERSGAELLSGHRIFDAPTAGHLRALCDATGRVVELRYGQLILATGARERFLPFPGWTLPGVFGAGGLQAMVSSGLQIEGKRVVVAGTGPLLLAVAAHLRRAGAVVVSVAEQAPRTRLLAFAAALCLQPAKALQGLRYKSNLRGVPYRLGCWPIAALPESSGTRLGAVRLTNGKRTWEEACDLLACGFHLVPNTELACLLGCSLQAGFVRVDRGQLTSVPGIYCVGEPTGIGGLVAALLQGEIAGRAAAGITAHRLLSRAAARERRFTYRLAKAFTLRNELRRLPRPETIVCRCEDVPYRDLQGRGGWTEAKLQTRCGMGPCQGRICGPALEFLCGWGAASVRPPLSPVPVSALCHVSEEGE